MNVSTQQALSDMEVPAAESDTLRRAQEALDTKVRPFMQSHGGDVHLIGVDHGVLEIRMTSACGACELKPVTLASRIRPTLLEVPGVEEVRCSAVPLSCGRLDQIASFFG